MKIVSIITVVYNNKKTIERCIKSVINQKDIGYEYIIIDGGSTDGTLDIIKKYENFIDVLVSEPDNGIYHAMNKGIERANGKYIALINSDDWLEPCGLRKSIDNIEKNNASASIGFANVWDKNEKFSHVWEIGNFDERILTSGMSFCHQALVASKEAYNIVGPFNENIKISSDYEWVKKLYLSELKVVFTKEPIVNFSFNGISANNRSVWKEECKQILKNQYQFLDIDDISLYLEYVYKDAPLDPNAAVNIFNQSLRSQILSKSVFLVLLDKLIGLEARNKNVVAIKNRIKIKEHKKMPDNTCDQKKEEWSPKISVIIPVYNVDNYIEECIKSVLEQNFKDIEVICVNDGTPDNSVKIIENLMQKDKRIKILHKKNGGLSSARNYGIKHARGEYIHFLDSDDYIKPGMYDALYKYAKFYNLEIVKSNLGFIDDVYPERSPIKPDKNSFLLSECPAYVRFISPCSALYSRKLLENTSLFKEGITYEDRPFNWETLSKANSIGHVSKAFYMYRVGRPGSIMSSRGGNIRHYDAFKAIDEIHSFLTKNNLMEQYLIEYIKEQLRVYSMLIDINAIPKKTIGRFYHEINKRFSCLKSEIESVRKSELPQRVKNLYEFFVSNEQGNINKLSGEAYFFHGINYQKTSRIYRASSCEQYLVAKYKIDYIYSSDGFGNIFRRSVMKAIIFDEIHNKQKYSNIGDLLFAIDSLSDIFQGVNIDLLIQLLSEVAIIKWPTKNQHLIYQAHFGDNYNKARIVLEKYFKERCFEYRIIDAKHINECKLSSLFRGIELGIIAELKAKNFRPNAFSQILRAAYYIKRNIGLDSLTTFTTLFPESPVEIFLRDLLKKQCAINFLPHGMPQLTMQSNAYDNVFSISNHSQWTELFPESKIIHIGFTEIEQNNIINKKIKKIDKMRVIFFSQLEGCRIHQLDDFSEIMNTFLRQCLNLPSDKYEFNFRLRNKDELNYFENSILTLAKKKNNIFFTYIADEDIYNCGCDLIVGMTSTALLYSQYLNVPVLQIVTSRLLDHWPFLYSPSNIVSLEQVEEDLEKILNTHKDVDCFSAILKEKEKYELFDKAYIN